MEDRNMMRKGAAALGGALIAIALAASPVGATPFTAHTSGQYTDWGVLGDDNALSHVVSLSLSSGHMTLAGAIQCFSYAYMDPSPIPTTRCDPTELEFSPISDNPGFLVCLTEDKDGFLSANIVAAESYACTSPECFGPDGSPVLGCSGTSHLKYAIQPDGSRGMYYQSTGSFTVTTTATYDDVTDAYTAGTLESDTVGDITLVGDAPPNDLFIEDPAAGSTQSGISLVRGWSCLGGQLEVQFSEADGTAIGEPASLAHGTPRADTEDVCGDTNNGFAMHIDWNILGTGQKTMTLIVNGEERATRNFSVQ